MDKTMNYGKPVMIYSPKLHHLHQRRLSGLFGIRPLNGSIELLGVPIIHEQVLLIIVTSTCSLYCLDSRLWPDAKFCLDS